MGAPIANRTRGETEGLIGFFVNTLVMRGPCGRQPHLPANCCAASRRPRWSAYAHQDLPFETLVDVIQRDTQRPSAA